MSVDTRKIALALGLVVIGVASRLMPHLPNLTPVMAIALFGGTYLPKRWSIALPLAIMAASDLVLGGHVTIPFTWGAFVLTGLIGWWVRERPRLGRIAAGALTGSALFFLITNVGVWLVAGLYPPTAGGLSACFAAAIPFFRAMLLGDLVYTAVLFGAFAVLTQPRALATR